MKTILRTLAILALATYLGVTSTGLRALRNALPTASPETAASSDWWVGAISHETNKWATLGRIKWEVRGE